MASIAVSIESRLEAVPAVPRAARSLKERVIHFGASPSRTSGRSTTSTSTSRRARRSACSATTARASRRCSSASPASCSRRRARSAVRGRLAALLELGAGFHPELTGRENVFMNASILGLSSAPTSSRGFDEIVEFAELEQFIDMQVQHYSSGMYVRLGFAVAVNVDPDILLVDEVLSVGDEAFQRKCLDRVAPVPGRRPHDPGRHPLCRPGAPHLRRVSGCSTTATSSRSARGRGDPHVPRAAPRRRGRAQSAARAPWPRG